MVSITCDTDDNTLYILCVFYRIVLVWRYKYVNKAKEERTMDLPVN